jgi:hypothetical protein
MPQRLAAHELHRFGIDVVAIRPGAILTEWNSIACDGLVEILGQWCIQGWRAHIKMMASADLGSMPSPPSVVARTIVQAVQARRPKTRYATGGGAQAILFLRQILSDLAFDATMRTAERQTTNPPRDVSMSRPGNFGGGKLWRSDLSADREGSAVNSLLARIPSLMPHVSAHSHPAPIGRLPPLK